MLLGWALGGDTAYFINKIKFGFGLATFGSVETDLGKLVRSALPLKSTHDAFVTSDGHFQLGSFSTEPPTAKPTPVPTHSPSKKPTAVSRNRDSRHA